MLVGWLLGFHLFGFGFLVFLVGGLGWVGFCLFLSLFFNTETLQI